MTPVTLQDPSAPRLWLRRVRRQGPTHGNNPAASGPISAPLVDILVEGGLITAVVPHREVEGQAGVDEIDGGGAWAWPGLHDHHIHLRATAAAWDSVPVGPPEVSDEADLGRALGRAPGRDWIRGVGYDESVAGALDRHRLDALCPHRPVRLQHRSGALWFLNGSALSRLGDLSDAPAGVGRDDQGRPDGRLFRLDAWLRQRLGEGEGPDLARLGARAAALGVTGFTEAGPEPSVADLEFWAGQVETGVLPQRLHLLSASEDPGPHPSAFGPRLSLGAVKILLDDADLPGLAELSARIQRAHARELPVAVHCVSREQLFLTLAALAEAGARPGDRIEHGAVVPPEAVPGLRHLGLLVVTNPGLAVERGDRHRHQVPEADRDHLYPAASLLGAGVALAAGSDAPYGPFDPWASVLAAMTRRTPAGVQVGAQEELGASEALNLFLGPAGEPQRRRRLEPGQPGDLFLSSAPVLDALRAGTAPPVALTVVGGRLIHEGRN